MSSLRLLNGKYFLFRNHEAGRHTFALNLEEKCMLVRLFFVSESQNITQS